MKSVSLFALLLAVFVHCAWGGSYTLSDNFQGTAFYDNFDFKTFDDPTQGYVTAPCAPACTMPATRQMTGFVNNNVCDHTDAADSGCSVRLAQGGLSYGPQFNANGDGFYAMEQTNEFIKVWFWARGSRATPAEVLSGSGSINTDNWGTPSAYFPNTDCDIATHFNERNIVINLTFCGGYAGGEFNQDGCPGECNDYVRNNPEAFVNAYFELLWVKVYEP
ncbi:hypothetical protein OF83DRAFT_1083992 [Amylostereum chailletii]|nr:hypothetical protein OF83DRAFT_1083992 [Amylostereum chailletii]